MNYFSYGGDKLDDDIIKKTNLLLPRSNKTKFEDIDKTPKPPTPIYKDSEFIPIPASIKVPNIP